MGEWKKDKLISPTYCIKDSRKFLNYKYKPQTSGNDLPGRLCFSFTNASN